MAGKSVIENMPNAQILQGLKNVKVGKSIPGKDNYFFNPAYDAYPAVGMNAEMAKYYCVWRTNRTNDSTTSVTTDFQVTI